LKSEQPVEKEVEMAKEEEGEDLVVVIPIEKEEQ